MQLRVRGRSTARTVTFLAIALTGCVPEPAAKNVARPTPEPAGLMSSEMYARKILGLRATLARSHVDLDVQAEFRTCGNRDAPGCLRCEVATREAIGGVDPDMIDAVATAFARYPPNVLTAAKLEHVALCRRIRYEHDAGRPDPAGVAVLEDHRLLISVEHFVGETYDYSGSFTIEEVVHHEMFHLLDYANLGAKLGNDAEWHALNAPAFAYKQLDTLAVPRPAGFVDPYASTDEAEDRASTFEYLMSHAAELCKIAADDPIVMKKVTVVWRRIAKLTGPTLLHAWAPCVRWPDHTKAPKSLVGKMR